jgi:alpha-beta hydrolase superfamily lysophospholipase
MINKKLLLAAVVGLAFNLSYAGLVEAKPMTVTAKTSDGVQVYGYQHFADLPAKSPLVLLFHQAGSNAAGEYGSLIPWLNNSGFRVISWDARAGGKYYGGSNQTLATLPAGTPKQYCDAYPDLQAALDHVKDKKLAEKVFIWGSSYSAALVFQLAAKNPNDVAGLVSFSPATGGPMAKCRARVWLDKVKTPILVMRPQSEMARESSIEQKKLLKLAGATLNVVEHGVHGASMLVDSRTENDMTAARKIVSSWMKGVK